MDWLGGQMNVKCKRLKGFLLLFLTVLLCGSNLTAYADSSVADWCTVRINQKGVGRGSGCTVVSLELLCQNSGTIKDEYKLDGDITSTTDTYTSFDNACTFHTGDGWILGNFTSGAGEVTNATWSTDIATEENNADTGDYSGVTVVTGVGNKNFKDMKVDEQLSAIKGFWNAGYFVVFCVEYIGNVQHNNGRDGFWANHATMLAGLDDSTIYLNDPASGSIVSYNELHDREEGNKYNLVYIVTFKNDKTAPNKLSSGGNAQITKQDTTNVTNMGLNAGTFYSESDLSAYVKLQEVDVSAMLPKDRSSLSQNELENLSSWEDNVKNSNREYGFIAWMRIIVMWVGIIFTIYIFLLYLAYWFDKLNSIIDLDVLSILTFGRLHVAIDDKEANFSLGKKQDRMTVSHKDMLFICITGLIFGTLLITGTFYKLVAGFVNFILRKLG
jgi:hypothetical protein